MISILYRDCLVLATAGKSDQIYTIKASIGLGDIRVEEVDNGRGRLASSPELTANQYRLAVPHGTVLMEASF